MNDKKNNEHDGDLTPDEQKRFESLPREMTPPEEWETAVVGALRRQGLLGARNPSRWGWPGVAWVAAPALVSLALGLLIGASWVRGGADPAGELPRYLLILRSGDEFKPEATPEAHRAEYADWAVNTLPRGTFLSGEELAENGWALRRIRGTVEANPLDKATDSREPVAGFFLIQAANAESAVTMAKTTPHLKYGGTVEVRPIKEARRK